MADHRIERIDRLVGGDSAGDVGAADFFFALNKIFDTHRNFTQHIAHGGRGSHAGDELPLVVADLLTTLDGLLQSLVEIHPVILATFRGHCNRVISSFVITFARLDTIQYSVR